jgi:histidinol-phosphate aminotransferase
MGERYQWEPSDDEIAARFGLDPATVVRFDQNTTPEPPSDASAVAAMAALGVNEYPDASYRALREAIARTAGVAPDRITVGAGADELILLGAFAFLSPGDVSVMVSPTYSLHRLAVLRVGATPVEVPLAASDFGVDADLLVDEASRSALTWLCVPNNPTGTRLDDDLVRRVIDATPGVTIVDAAYAEVAGDEWAGWLADHPRLVVLRTFSKGYALAGARVGYAMTSPDLVADFDDVRPPGSISSISAALAIAAVEDQKGLDTRVAALRAERERLFGMLTELGLEPTPSEANFLLCRIGPRAAELSEALMSEGLVVRTYGEGPLAEYLRFTVRSPEEDDRLVDALRRHL